MYRINLNSGDITTVLSPSGYYSASISPTSKRLVYVTGTNPRKLFIEDFQTGELSETDFPPRYSQAGKFVWSADGLRLAYMAIIDGDDCFRTIAIRFIDIEEMSTSVIVDDMKVDSCQEKDPTFNPIEIIDGKVILEQHGDIWAFDISTEELFLQATSTSEH